MFTLLGWSWDVDTAARLAKRHPVQQADIGPWTALLGWIRTDPDHAATADLTRPLLAVPLPNTSAPGNHLVIDGWHRIRRAVTEGVAQLPAVFLDEGDERACRIHGGGL
ncbi:hypothetical protein DPM19_12040 [Actinomadura craniellae]|uniref:ParB/Sulfiredoxin domain-containing protein n=2 Tax=Actinomadura craniellae TaxID=2231787 RepID=A0A365H8K5_9ACTN|nr:hypothetical protein DPM19_12040 [Actinomadura craniellae]